MAFQESLDYLPVLSERIVPTAYPIRQIRQLLRQDAPDSLYDANQADTLRHPGSRTEYRPDQPETITSFDSFYSTS